MPSIKLVIIGIGPIRLKTKTWQILANRGQNRSTWLCGMDIVSHSVHSFGNLELTKLNERLKISAIAVDTELQSAQNFYS